MTDDRQRIDKWLWHARVVRTRAAAAALASSGHVRVNGSRIDAASRAVKAGDVITVALDRVVRVLKVAGFAERRGDAEAARPLYEDLTEPAPPRPTGEAAMSLESGSRDAGSGRPTKRERRLLDRLQGEHEEQEDEVLSFRPVTRRRSADTAPAPNGPPQFPRNSE